MAAITITGGQTFPEGTSVSAYPRTAWPAWQPPSGAPSGSAVATGTITGGTVTFSGLSDGTDYVAYASSIDRRKHFTVPPVSAGSSSGQVLHDLVGYDSRKLNLPKFTKYTGNPILRRTDLLATPVDFTSGIGMFWAWVIRVDDLPGSPARPWSEKYRLYYSTDHGQGAGHCRVATADSPTGPFTDRGEIYRDATGGQETETPSVVFNEDEGLFFMYYQQVSPLGGTAGFGQHTLLATSANGIDNWTRVGVVLPLSAEAVWPKSGHTGYMRPFRIGQRWYGYSLMSGGNRAKCMLNHSDDGRTWMSDPAPLPHHSDLIGNGLRFDWLTANVFRVNGQLWVMANVVDFLAGTANTVADPRIAPLAADFRSLLGPPKSVFAGQSLQAWESTLNTSSNLLYDGGRLYFYYRSGSTAPAHAFGVAVSEVV